MGHILDQTVEKVADVPRKHATKWAVGVVENATITGYIQIAEKVILFMSQVVITLRRLSVSDKYLLKRNTLFVC